MIRTQIGGGDPTSEDIAKLQADMASVTAAANAAVEKEREAKKRALVKTPSKESFLTRDAFAGLVWWQVILGGVGTLAIGTGIFSLISGGNKK